jgi:hypothetical protein
VCVFFAFQDPDHYAYAHLSSAADANAHNVLLVDAAPRASVTTRRSEGVDWGWNEWRRVRVEVDPEAGTARVLVDGTEALFSDRVPARSGYVGFGSFDDEMRVDNIRIWSGETEAVACTAYEPIEASEREEGIRFEPGDGRVRVLLDGELFTDYIYQNTPKPYLAPVLGPGGVRMTRGFPMEQIAGEQQDHPHHTGLWWAHGDINGLDLWHAGASLKPIGEPMATDETITALYELHGNGPTGVTIEQSIRFDRTLSGDRLIDITVTATAPQDEPLVFGDTKEGTMAIRTHPALRLTPAVPDGVTGRGVNSEGVTGIPMWGLRATWVDYTGEIDGKPVGVAVFDHPENPRFPTWWMARDYGLVGANPFGRMAFEPALGVPGEMRVPPGRSVTFKYRFLFHRYATNAARIPDAFARWSGAKRGPYTNRIAGEATILNDDGGWCWFEGERALIVGDSLVAGAVAAGIDDPDRRGDIELVIHNLRTGDKARLELHDKLELDDHNQPGLCDLGDGRVLAMWAKHGPENRIYRAIIDVESATFEVMDPVVPSESTRVTYSNVYKLAAESEAGRVYDFFRGLDGSWKPSFICSDDDGQSWTTGSVIINVPTEQRHRPYVRYASDGERSIHMVYTEGHPRNYDNSVYHIVYEDGQLRTSDGAPIAPLSEGLSSPDQGTRIFQGDADHVAWVTDLRLDDRGNPVAVFSVQVGSAGLPVGQGGWNHQYRYARWNGFAWEHHDMAPAGSRLYPREDDYTGLAAIDPTDVNVVYISTNAYPTTGDPLWSRSDGKRHWEIYRGETLDGGRSWRWTPVTSDSTVDNLRPVVAAGGGRKVLLWLRGTYRTYTDYDLDVMALEVK